MVIRVMVIVFSCWLNRGDPTEADRARTGQRLPEADIAAGRTSGPHLVCDQPDHDIGTVWAGEVVRHDFIIRNVGDETAWVKQTIGGVQPFITCRFSILPGESIRMPVAVDSKRTHGQFTRIVWLRLIDPPPDGQCMDCKHGFDSAAHVDPCGPVCSDDRSGWCVRPLP